MKSGNLKIGIEIDLLLSNILKRINIEKIKKKKIYRRKKLKIS